MLIRFLSVIVVAAVGVSFSGTTSSAQIRIDESSKINPTKTKSATVRIKFSGTGTCAYVDASGAVRLKPGQTLPTCDPNDTSLHFERTPAPAGSYFRHLGTSLCLQIVEMDSASAVVRGVPCSQAKGFDLPSVASGGRVQFKQMFGPTSGPCCVRYLCMSVTGAGGSQNLAVLAGLCKNEVPMRFTIEPVF